MTMSRLNLIELRKLSFNKLQILGRNNTLQFTSLLSKLLCFFYVHVFHAAVKFHLCSLIKFIVDFLQSVSTFCLLSFKIFNVFITKVNNINIVICIIRYWKLLNFFIICIKLILSIKLDRFCSNNFRQQ